MIWAILPWLALGALVLAVFLLVLRIFVLQSRSAVGGALYLVIAGLIVASLGMAGAIAYRRMVVDQMKEDAS